MPRYKLYIGPKHEDYKLNEWVYPRNIDLSLIQNMKWFICIIDKQFVIDEQLENEIELYIKEYPEEFYYVPDISKMYYFILFLKSDESLVLFKLRFGGLNAII